MVIRPGPEGIAVYLTRRNSRSRFMPDAYVFPGGAVDSGDGEAPHSFAVAALRELFEEADMLIARDASGGSARFDEEMRAELRARAQKGASLVALLRERGASLDTGALTYYSNWITPATEPVRFDTHFFVARAPEGQAGRADAREVHDGTWFPPHEALALAQRGEMTIRFPTRKHLERLARAGDVETFIAHARERSIVAVNPVDDGTGTYGMDFDDRW